MLTSKERAELRSQATAEPALFSFIQRYKTKCNHFHKKSAYSIAMSLVF